MLDPQDDRFDEVEEKIEEKQTTIEDKEEKVARITEELMKEVLVDSVKIISDLEKEKYDPTNDKEDIVLDTVKQADDEMVDTTAKHLLKDAIDHMLRIKRMKENEIVKEDIKKEEEEILKETVIPVKQKDDFKTVSNLEKESLHISETCTLYSGIPNIFVLLKYFGS